MSLREIASVPFLLVAISLVAGPRGIAAQADPPDPDSSFQALQERGAVGMGVDQYVSTHLFDALPDGGRIEYQYDRDDAEEIEQIRRHLKEIQEAFRSGDFSTPAFVHDQEVPGTDVLAERREYIEYEYRDLPRGGELRLVTEDPEALDAIREFMAFQRADYRASGMDHGSMDHGAMDHGGMDHGSMDQGSMDHGSMDRGSMGHGSMDHAGEEPEAMSRAHELLMNREALTRTVEHVPGGVRTVTESEDPEVASRIIALARTMEARLQAGEALDLFGHAPSVLFEDSDGHDSTLEYTRRGVAVVQTSEDPARAEALRNHAERISQMLDEGVAAHGPGHGAGHDAGHDPPIR